MNNILLALLLFALPGCAYVEVRDGERVTRGLQLGGIAPVAESARPVSVNRWVAGFWASAGQLSVGVVREAAWVVPPGQSCVFQGAVGGSPVETVR